MSAPTTLERETGEPGFDSAGPSGRRSFADLGAAAGFLLASLPVGLFWLVVLAGPLLLAASVALAWAAGFALTRLLLVWTARRPAWRTLASGLTLISAPLVALSVRGARAERRRIEASLGRAVPSPYRRPPGGGSARDPAVWRDLAYLLALPVVGAAEFALTVAAFLSLVAAATLPAWIFVAFPGGFPLWNDARIDGLAGALAVATVALPVCAFACYLTVGGLAPAHAALGRALLGPSRRARLAERVEELAESRSRMLAATLAERRRIERDLHDGAQQRLVSLAMELGMAREKLATDPDAARGLVEGAHGEAKRALAELRDLVRGIHPAVLSDRGLDAAISALADRCPVPVEVDVRLEERPPEAVETTAYFVVAEALANVAKHSGASEARVSVRGAPERRLVVEVTDDGRGGADPEASSGLGGLRDRLAALDGRLAVKSPPGGPTRVLAELPLVDPGGGRSP